MTYAQGQRIQAGDYNGFTGGLSSTQAFPSDVAATNAIAAVYGVGYGSRGYGQTTYLMNPVAIGQVVSHNEWVQLLGGIDTIKKQTGVTQVSPYNPFPSGGPVAGNLIIAHDGGGPPSTANLISLVANCDANRLSVSPTSLTFFPNLLTITRGTAWGTGGSSTITAIFTTSWGNENATRYFFNSGGVISIVLSQPVIANTEDSDWQSTFNTKVGTISFGANSTSWTGTWPGSPANAGYYQLTSSPQTVFNGLHIGTSGAYTSNSIFVNAQYIAGGTTNGAKGFTLQFTIQLVNNHVGTTQMSAGTNAVMSFKKATTFLSGIVSPSFVNTQNF